MKKQLELGDFSVVFVGEYTRESLKGLLFGKPRLERVHDLIKQVVLDIPEKSESIRSQIAVRENTNLGIFQRPANLFELAGFLRRFPKFTKRFGAIECFDSYIERFGKETGIPCIVPVASFGSSASRIMLERHDRKRTSRYTLVVV